MLSLKSLLKINKYKKTTESNATIMFDIAKLNIRDNGKIKTRVDNILFKLKESKKILPLFIKNFFYLSSYHYS